MSLPADEGIALLNYAFAQEEEGMIFQRWIPLQGFISYDEFKSGLQPVKFVSTKKTLEDVGNIIDSMQPR